jgi:tellurite resistance protein TehA-like permease
MSTLTSLARAVAVASGTAQRTRTVRHVHIGPRPLVFIPLALAGEAGAPLAAMVGDAPGRDRLHPAAGPLDPVPPRRRALRRP